MKRKRVMPYLLRENNRILNLRHLTLEEGILEAEGEILGIEGNILTIIIIIEIIDNLVNPITVEIPVTKVT
ncbi:MAG: hypothetical protein Q8835_03130 [Sweet potato little leaf phytoplasma]|nr:hypothetical protein [Sweet potato little leaf phytoplasma]